MNQNILVYFCQMQKNLCSKYMFYHDYRQYPYGFRVYHNIYYDKCTNLQFNNIQYNINNMLGYFHTDLFKI